MGVLSSYFGFLDENFPEKKIFGQFSESRKFHPTQRTQRTQRGERGARNNRFYPCVWAGALAATNCYVVPCVRCVRCVGYENYAPRLA